MIGGEGLSLHEEISGVGRGDIGGVLALVRVGIVPLGVAAGGVCLDAELYIR